MKGTFMWRPATWFCALFGILNALPFAGDDGRFLILNAELFRDDVVVPENQVSGEDSQ